jgi:hypothetical protein
MKRILQTGPNSQLGGVRAVLLMFGYQLVTLAAVNSPPKVLAIRTEIMAVNNLGQSIFDILLMIR